VGVGCFCLLSTTGDGGGVGCEIGLGSVLRLRGLRAARRVDLRVVSLEGCLTISSEERETWTAVSLRGSSGASRMVPKGPLTVTFQTTIPVGSGLSERREMVARLRGLAGSVFGTRHRKVGEAR